MRTGPTTLRRLLARPDWLVLLAISGLFLLSAVYTVAGVGMDMSALRMTTMAGMADMPAGHAPGRWTAGYFVLVVLMWWFMMAAMMIASATPTILLHAALTRCGDTASGGNPRISLALLAGYLTVWCGFSVAAALTHWVAESAGLVSAGMMTATAVWVSSAVLIAAGAWQRTAIKDACLRHCRSPADYLIAHRSKPGARFAGFRLGVAHGTYCVGCCWGLMALLFVGGVTNLYWIVGLAALVAAEKLLPYGPRIAKLSGIGLIGSGVFLSLVRLGTS